MWGGGLLNTKIRIRIEFHVVTLVHFQQVLLHLGACGGVPVVDV